MKKYYFIILLSCLLVTLEPCGVFASELTSSGVLLANEGESKTGFLNFKTDLGIYTLVVFVLLFLLLRWKAWGPIIDLLDQREMNIKKAYDDAEVARKEAQSYLDQAKGERERIYEEMKTLMDETRKDANQLKEKLKADTATEIQTERERLRREIEAARDQALQDIWSQAVTLATLLSTKVVRKDLTSEDHRRLVADAMKEVDQSMKA